MPDINYYSKIPGLLVPKDASYDLMCDNIDRYIDTIPGLVRLLEKSLSTSVNDLLKHMDTVFSLLRSVYARGLETEVTRLVILSKNDYRMLAANKLLPPLTTSLLSLSIEMQKAQNSEDGQNEETISEIESHADMKNNLSALDYLIENRDYESAKSIITALDECNPEYAFDIDRLLSLLLNEEYDEAKNLVRSLKEKHNDKIEQLRSADLTKKILALDDMPEVLTFIKNALKHHYKVLAAANASTATYIIEAQKPDLFILDIDMPDMNGLEFAELIRGTPEFIKTPIIFLTGNATREHALKAIKVGANDFIIKPTTYEYLLNKVSKYININVL